VTLKVTFTVLNLSDYHTLRNLQCINLQNGKRTWLVMPAVFDTEGLLKVTGSHVHIHLLQDFTNKMFVQLWSNRQDFD